MLAAAKTVEAPGIELVELDKPVAAEREVLVEVAFCGICGSDLPVYAWDGAPEKWAGNLPRVMGHEFAGYTMEDLDGRFPAGTLVAVEPGTGCGHCRQCRDGLINLCPFRNILGIDRDGAFAPYVSVPQSSLWPMPEGIDARRAAFLEVFALAVHAIERARLRPNDRVLIVGAGPVAIAIAAICARSAAAPPVLIGAPGDASMRLPLARGVGAEAMVTDELSDSPHFDVVFEASGAIPGVAKALKTCITGGKIVALGTPPRDLEYPWEEMVMRAIRITPVRARLPRHWVAGAELLSRLEFPDQFFVDFKLADIDAAFVAASERRACKVMVTPT
jgi:threonine dehydrogenase-like Zn-dependent dehydrogenase